MLRRKYPRRIRHLSPFNNSGFGSVVTHQTKLGGLTINHLASARATAVPLVRRRQENK